MPNNINWAEAYNRLFAIINTKIESKDAPYYVTGPKFINTIKGVDFSLPTRSDVYMKDRADKGLSTSREVWFKELLDGLTELKRHKAYKEIIALIEPFNPPKLDELKKQLGLGSGETVITIVEKPDPELGQNIYDHVVGTIDKVMKSYEQKHAKNEKKSEEELRDHIIAFLELQYKNTVATREAFNKNGKTDILIKYTDQTNLFVAECKYWSGAVGMHQTIDQLIGYLTWRDSKAAVVFFVDNVDFSAVLAKIKAEVPNHPLYVSHEKDTNTSSFSYKFHFPGDNAKTITIEIMAYHLPN